MAQNYEIDIKRFNGQDYDTLLPTPAAHASTHQVDGSDPITMQTGNYAEGSVTRAKLAIDALYSPTVASNSRNITVSDLGKTIYTPWNASATYTLTQANSSNIPLGGKITIIKWGSSASSAVSIVSNGVRFASNGDSSLRGTGTTLRISGFFSAVTLKKMSTDTANGDTWFVEGRVEVVGAVAAMANSNFLDNSDFTQFVAQAGVGGQHGTQAYAGDRWILDSGSVTGTANANGNGFSRITLNGTIRQVLANPPATGTPVINMVSGTATISYAGGEVTITSAGGVIKNVGLYEGTYATGSKPKYRPKGYGAELAECILYFRRLESMSNIAMGQTATNAWLTSFALSPPMRVAPSLAHSGALIWGVGSGWQTAPLGLYLPTPNGFVLTLAHSGIAAGTSYIVAIDTLWLSADLE